MNKPSHESIVRHHNSYVSAALRELAGPRMAGDPIKAAVSRAAKRAGIDYWRAYDIWYERNRRLDAEEETQILQALAKRRKMVALNEFAELRTRMARLEAMLERTDSEFYGADIAALRAANRSAD